MRFKAIGTLTVALAAFSTAIAAQNATAPAPVVRTVIFNTKLTTVTDAPLHFKVLNVTLAAGQRSSVSSANSVLYQLSGSMQVTLDGVTQTIGAGEGLWIPSGKNADLHAGGAESNFFHYSLASASEVDKPLVQAPAVAREAYRTQQPIPDLKTGPYDFNLTRVTFPPGMPSNAPHYRSGAALYYVISGTGVNTIDGEHITRPPGSFIYEPFGLVHQWGNPGTEPLTFVTLNINPEGVAAVLQGSP